VFDTVKSEANEEVAAYDALNTDIDDVCEFNTNAVAVYPSKKLASDADIAKDAEVEFNVYEADTAKEEVPFNEPVIPPVTVKDPVI
jgi:hypothetical protein